MNRTARDKTLDRPKPVERIELSEGNSRRKLILVCVFLAIALAAFGYGISQMLRTEAGWTTIQVQGSSSLDCSRDFVFQYDFTGDRHASSDAKAMTRYYTELCQYAFIQFHPSRQWEEYRNVAYLNAHPNETVQVDPLLYRSLEAMEGTRYLYLGPVYEMARAMFYSASDEEAASYNPELDPAMKDFYRETAAFASDPDSVDVELLGNNQVCLKVSDRYLRFCEENGTRMFLDFAWMTNALIADYFADQLMASGYTSGCISSFDGFCRCLDSREILYSLNLYTWQDDHFALAGTADYRGPMSAAVLRDYPVSAEDTVHYYRSPDGSSFSIYLDPADAVNRSGIHEIYGLSENMTCAQLALAMAPVFISREADLSMLKAFDAQWITADGGTLQSTGEQMTETIR